MQIRIALNTSDWYVVDWRRKGKEIEDTRSSWDRGVVAPRACSVG